MEQQQDFSNTYKSLTPRDSQYHSYLMGSFSDTERAIPQPSLNPHSANDIITFEIRAINKLEPASNFKKMSLLVKPQTWLTVFIPWLVISRIEATSTLTTALLLLISLVSLMVYANWQADLADHLAGWDRLDEDQEKSVLQKGWFTGHQLQMWSRGILIFNFILAIPLIMHQPLVLVPYILSVLSILLFLPKWWRQSLRPGVSSFFIFLLAGPLLTIGIDLAIDGQLTKNSVFLGFAWGLWMSFVRQQNIYCKQWRPLNKQPSYSFLNLGFDRAKALMRLLIVMIPGVMLMNFVFVSGGAAWFFPMLVTHSFFVFWELHFNEKIQSSISSSLRSLQTLFRWHFYVVSMMMVIGAIIWKTTL